MKRKIIYIDDEVINLELFDMLLSPHYEVVLSEDPLEALDMIIDQHIPLVITDYRMPEMDGAELITKVKAVNPECVCIMVSGYEKNDIPLRKDLLHDFVPKPFIVDHLLGIIESGFREYEANLQKAG